MPLAAEIFQERASNAGGCTVIDIVQVKTPAGGLPFETVWYSEIGEGTLWWSSPGEESPLAYGGASYTIPAGDSAWLVAAGSGGNPDGCNEGLPAGTFGVKGWVLKLPGTGISGKIVTAAKDPLSGVTVRAINQASGETYEATTNEEGEYSFPVPPDSYYVEPVPSNLPAGGDEFKTELCEEGDPGVNAGGGGYCDVTVPPEQEGHADFNAGFTLSGKVLNVEDKPIAGASVLIKDTEQGTGKLLTSEPTTNGDGEFKERLAPGSVVVGVKPVSSEEFFPASKECNVVNTNCEVNLDQDRSIDFASCVLPNPNGEPLPASTPEPIPGAVLAPPLEAVGCWKPANGSSQTATEFTSVKPVRLDGVDLSPSPGTTITLKRSVPLIETNGPAEVLIDGYGVSDPQPLRLAYQGGVSAPGSSVASIQDLGAGSGPAALGLNLFGLPISLGTGGPLGYGLPFIESTGQTTINLGLQFELPWNTRGSWNFLQGKFVDEEGEGVPSIGLSGSINLTNRYGIQTGQLCGSINDWKPFGEDGGEISGLQICYSPTQHQWTGSGMFELPGVWQNALKVGDIYVQVALQAVTRPHTDELQGYQLASAQFEFDHLAPKTIPLGEEGEVKVSGIPIGLGMYLESLRGGFINNLAGTNSASDITDPFVLQLIEALAHPVPGTISDVYAGAGISFGPEVTVDGVPVDLFRLDGTLNIMPPKYNGNPEDNWVYQGSLKGTFARLSPIELQLGNASLTYHWSLTSPEADFQSRVGSPSASSFWSLIGGFNTELRGVINNSVGNLFEGVQSLKVGRLNETKEVLIWLDEFKHQRTVAACYTLGSFSAGFSYNFITKEGEASCDMGAFQHPVLSPSALGSSVSETASADLRLRLPAGQRGIELAIKGNGAPPKVTLARNGERISARGATKPQLSAHAVVFTDPKNDTTYIVLVHPHGGLWTLRRLSGSAPIASVRYADALREVHVSGRVSRDGCGDLLRYREQPSSGDKAMLFVQEGKRRTLLGTAHPGRGHYSVPMYPGIAGRGEVIAVLLHDGRPIGTHRVATFANAASNGSERPSRLSVHTHLLKWHPACAASNYDVTIIQSGKPSHETTVKPELTLPAGRAKVTITAYAPGGLKLGSTRTSVL